MSATSLDKQDIVDRLDESEREYNGCDEARRSAAKQAPQVPRQCKDDKHRKHASRHEWRPKEPVDVLHLRCSEQEVAQRFGRRGTPHRHDDQHLVQRTADPRAHARIEYYRRKASALSRRFN